jgi:hypothetical protein
VVASLRQSLNQIGGAAGFPFSLRTSFGGRLSRSLRMAVGGMTNPEVVGWTHIGEALSIENTDDSNAGQGLATDGSRWFVSSNGSQRVVIYDDAENLVSVHAPTQAVKAGMWRDAGLQGGDYDPHFGALAFHAGTLFVPIQKPWGIWRIDLSNGAQTWTRASVMPDENMFPWCAVHPVTGILYTCTYDYPQALRAYDRDTLAYRPQDDIPLSSGPMDLDHVQGGVFTDRGRVILVRYDFNAVFCFSSLNGYCFGAKRTGGFGSTSSELEAVVVRDWQINGIATPVHLLELDGDWDGDDLYLHSFSIPHPSQL